MADYWISQTRKRCDFCDCWIADNRASIDFHERGKRHKENVEKKIAELRKKGQEQYKQQQSLAGSLKKMEEDALKKFQQDVANDPALSAKYKAMQEKAEAKAEAATTSAEKGENSKSQKDDTVTSKQEDEQQQEHYPVWYEGTGPDGRVYYWNSKTQESQWDKPPDFDGVTAQADQEDTNEHETESKTNTEANTSGEDDDDDANTSGEDDDDEEEEDSEEESKETSQEKEYISEVFADRRPEKRKASAAYGTWTTVEVEKEELVDLQLPENKNNYLQYVPKAAQNQPREKLKFKEKTVASLSSKTVASLSSSSSTDSNVGFKKKRKFGGNVRKRDTTA